MREFVASVLSNVKKVDSGMQTDDFVHGVPAAVATQSIDNLSALVNIAVEQGPSQVPKVEPISELQTVSTDEQYTLVMQDDGSEGYLISNYDGGAVSEEIVTLPSQQVEISSNFNDDQSSSTVTNSLEYTGDLVVKTLEKIVAAEEASSNIQVEPTKPVQTIAVPQQPKITILSPGAPAAASNQVKKTTMPRILPKGVVPKLPQINVIQGGRTIASIPVKAGKIQLPSATATVASIAVNPVQTITQPSEANSQIEVIMEKMDS